MTMGKMSLSFGRDMEFRVFLPVVKDDNETPTEGLSAYKSALARVIDDFTVVDGIKKDSISVTPMLYCVGGNHWGVKYRGPDRNLEVKYRKNTMEVGDCERAIELYKKKKFGKVSLKKMKKKIMEKLVQHCGAQHDEDQQKYAAEAIEAERLIALDKKRKGYYHGEVDIDFAYIDINLSNSTFHKKPLGGESSDPWRDSHAFESSEKEDEPSTPKDVPSEAGAEWISICFEGNYDTIVRAIRTNFDPIAAAMSEGLKVGLPVMVGGYPTFVNLVGNGLTYGNDCNEAIYGLYTSTIKGPTEALLAFHAANRVPTEKHAKEETNAYYCAGDPRIQLH